MEQIKKYLYFPIAWYFKFFAEIRLRRWKPRVIVVTGSNGKTTLLHMIESQIGAKARYSHHANSAFGIPFDILDLHRSSMATREWITLILKAPLQAFARLPKEKLYIVEADCDRPGEGKFLAQLLRPEVVLWVSVSRTHGVNFDHLVATPPGGWHGHPPGVGTFTSVDEAIAYEYGYFLEYCQKLAVINGDNSLQIKQTGRTKAKVIEIKRDAVLKKYHTSTDGTVYEIDGKRYTFTALLPEAMFYSIALCRELLSYLDLPFDQTFARFQLPPGRSTLLQGIKHTTLIDSSYNANLESIKVMLHMFARLPGKKKWVVLGDMLELGEKEREEHEELAKILSVMNLDRIILVGKRTAEFTYPKLLELIAHDGKVQHADREDIRSFVSARGALDDIMEFMNGGEEILFKGSQSIYLEGIIEPLLSDKKDARTLPRRGSFWEEKRSSVGL